MARMRWRRLWRARIQELLTATIQNITILVRYARGPHPVAQTIRALPQNAAVFAGGMRFDPFLGSGASVRSGLWISTPCFDL